MKTVSAIIKAESWQSLIEDLTLQQSFLDQFSTAWVADYRSTGGQIHCGRCCRECCSLTVNCTVTEAMLCAQSLSVQQLKSVDSYVEILKVEVVRCSNLKEYLRMQRSVLGWCPLLEQDGACGSYGSRPLACRALLSTKENRWCGIDFAGLAGSEKENYLQSLDQSVTAFPLHYVASTQETGHDLEARALSRLEQYFGFSLYGCMPVLIHLLHNHDLADAFSSGRGAVEECLESAGLLHPYLVTFSPD